MPVTASEHIQDSFARSLKGFDQGPLGLAVSGGGDSVAMLMMAAGWAKPRDVSLRVYTVDHGLRSEAADEAVFVALLCDRLGIPQLTLRWDGWSGSGNLSAKARDARYDLIAGAAVKDGVASVLLAHTRDDQAETVLMALARRSGVDGLSGMPVARDDRGVTWLRPLLGVTREDLRDYLRASDQEWKDDPSNDDTGYERVRFRQAMADLGELGLTQGVISDVAGNMQRVREVLEHVTAEALLAYAKPTAGAVRLDEALLNLPEETQRRVLSRCLGWVAPTAKPSRGDAVRRALIGLSDGTDTALQGCLVQRKKTAIWVIREPSAVAGTSCGIHQVWDGRWKVRGPDQGRDLHIGPLGEAGLADHKNWRDSGYPRAVLLSSPAVWRHDCLIAAPLLGYSPEWSAENVRSERDFHNDASGR